MPEPREVIARAIERDKMGSPLGKADTALAALRSAPEATRLALIRDLLPATHAVVPVKQGVMEMEQTTAGMRAAMLEQIADEPATRSASEALRDPPIRTCPRCGAKAAAFICAERGCPVNGGAAHG